MKYLKISSSKINLQALPRKTRNIFKIIERLENCNSTIYELKRLLNLSQASVYRLISICNDLLWDDEIVSDGINFKIQKRGLEK